MALPDPYAYLQEVARRLPNLTRPADIEALLDDVEYLFEVMPPELQDPAYAIIEQLRAKRETAAL